MDQEANPKRIPIVGIGASAGGLAAFESFFSGMPTDSDPGMAFVLVQHLDPDHRSLLTELIRRYTRMDVYEVEDGMTVRLNCAYIIPPNRDMALEDGMLRLLEFETPRSHRTPIDFFFRSLADSQGENAICVVLSGTGSDGTQGVRAIKAAGGMAMAQTPASTDFDGMPRSALATGLVDYELPPDQMGESLITFARQAFFKKPIDRPENEDALQAIFDQLRTRTGHDFSKYKTNTLTRRMQRRMALHQVPTIVEYVEYIEREPQEVDALFRDLLIGVTNFFRDKDAFEALNEKALPELFAGKSAGDTIRVWCPACATGEEVYSLAILLKEHVEKTRKDIALQIFATDIDARAIAAARAGNFPASIAGDVSQERLSRFFTLQDDGQRYRIQKSIRDVLIFSEQDVTRDPPFSKLDLISCRNLLIYLSGELQKKLIPAFYYGLNPGGFLFLGTSESVGEFSDRFETVDRKFKLYRRTENAFHDTRHIDARPLHPLPPRREPASLTGDSSEGYSKLPLRELTEQAILRQIAPAGALVDRHGNILYLHGRSGMYLEPSPGEAGVNNMLKMAREGLRHELSAALHDADTSKKAAYRLGIRVKTNGSHTVADLSVHPVEPNAAVGSTIPLYAVVLQDSNRSGVAPPVGDHAKPGDSAESHEHADATIASLREELRLKDEYLRTTIEELEISNEEMKSSNEEMHSVNEELQSTNEELETSREELQSVNEELAIVNSELQATIDELTRVNNDLNNLLSGTGIATIFVDRQLRIIRFTPKIGTIINLIPADVGRPLAHIVSNLCEYDTLVKDTQHVLETLVPEEKEVQSKTGAWYSMRIQPYRTLEDAIEGAVINFVDISERREIEEELSKASEVIRNLHGILPICASCKKIRDEHGRWQQMEAYVSGHSEAQFTHGYCPECADNALRDFEDHDKRNP